MKFSFLSKPADQETKAVQKAGTLQELRLNILNNLLIAGSLFGLVDYFFVVLRGYFLGKTVLPALIVYTVVTLWVIVITIFRKLPYQLRALSLVGMVYILGVTSYLQGGVTTDGAIFLLAFITLTTLLIGLRGSIVSSILSVASAFIIGWMMQAHKLIPPDVFGSDNLFGWMNRLAVLLLLCAVIGFSLTAMLKGLHNNLLQTTKFAQELEKDQEYLKRHAQDLERRSQQIRAAAEISRALSGVLTSEKLYQKAADLIQERFNLYYVGIFTIDESGRTAYLQAGTGEAGKAMMGDHHRLPVAESSMIGWTIIHRQARIALDVGEDAIRFANPYLPNTHSELALPLLSGEQIIGAITIQSDQAEAFDEDDITILQNITDTLAIAFENSRLFSEAQSALDELKVSQRSYVNKVWSEAAQAHEAYEYTSGSKIIGTEGASIDVPLTLRDQIIGQLHLESDQEWTPEEQSLIEAVASQAALAMENARLLEESQQTALRERLVAEITGKVWSSPNTEFILQTAVKELARALRTDDAVIELKMDR